MFLNRLYLPGFKDYLKQIDEPFASEFQADAIEKKSFLKNVYEDFYQLFQDSVMQGAEQKTLVELGSGGGFLKDRMPEVITSDIAPLKGIDKCFSALKMPFANESVDAFFMLNVFHHLNNVAQFFSECTRCLKSGGKIVMIEPANTLLSRVFYQHFHNEAFDRNADWNHDGGRLSAGNLALPWIVFIRDRARLEKALPSLRILTLEAHTPFRYVLSGGFSLKQLVPSILYKPVVMIEKMFSPLNAYLGLYLTIEIEKNRS